MPEQGSYLDSGSESFVVNSLNEEFTKYAQFARPLVLSLRYANDRVNAAKWVRRLLDEDSTEADALQLRNTYLKLLLYVLHYGVLEGPFTSAPPEQDLPSPPERTELVNMVHKLVSKKRTMPPRDAEYRVYWEKSFDRKVAAFVQPIPKFGVQAYFAVSHDPIETWVNTNILDIKGRPEGDSPPAGASKTPRQHAPLPQRTAQRSGDGDSAAEETAVKTTAERPVEPSREDIVAPGSLEKLTPGWYDKGLTSGSKFQKAIDEGQDFGYQWTARDELGGLSLELRDEEGRLPWLYKWEPEFLELEATRKGTKFFARNKETGKTGYFRRQPDRVPFRPGLRSRTYTHPGAGGRVRASSTTAPREYVPRETTTDSVLSPATRRRDVSSRLFLSPRTMPLQEDMEERRERRYLHTLGVSPERRRESHGSRLRRRIEKLEESGSSSEEQYENRRGTYDIPVNESRGTYTIPPSERRVTYTVPPVIYTLPLRDSRGSYETPASELGGSYHIPPSEHRGAHSVSARPRRSPTSQKAGMHQRALPVGRHSHGQRSLSQPNRRKQSPSWGNGSNGILTSPNDASEIRGLPSPHEWPESERDLRWLDNLSEVPFREIQRDMEAGQNFHVKWEEGEIPEYYDELDLEGDTTSREGTYRKSRGTFLVPKKEFRRGTYDVAPKATGDRMAVRSPQDWPESERHLGWLDLTEQSFSDFRKDMMEEHDVDVDWEEGKIPDFDPSEGEGRLLATWERAREPTKTREAIQVIHRSPPKGRLEREGTFVVQKGKRPAAATGDECECRDSFLATTRRETYGVSVSRTQGRPDVIEADAGEIFNLSAEDDDADFQDAKETNCTYFDGNREYSSHVEDESCRDDTELEELRHGRFQRRQISHPQNRHGSRTK